MRHTLFFLVPLILVSFVSGCLIHRDLIRGPRLQPTKDSASLQPVFPPVANRSTSQLEGARRYADSLGTTAVIAIQNGQLLAEWGATEKRISVHSVRKSLVSALYGIAVSRGMIDINQTLEALGIDDKNPQLTKAERQARLEDLLTARSGIYHPSVKDDNGPSPERGAHPPNTFFHYNNWSFNASGIIFEELTGLTLGEAFKAWIADPIGMQDFRVEDVRYYEGKESAFPAFRFWMSGRDLARFGVLYLQEGRWEGKQIIPASWIEASMVRYSDLGDGVGYGYMWWLMPDGTYMATGTGGQKIIIDPQRELVVVNRVNTGERLGRLIWWKFGPRVNNPQLRHLINLILEASPENAPVMTQS